jgi:hypothetical protein
MIAIMGVIMILSPFGLHLDGAGEPGAFTLPLDGVDDLRLESRKVRSVHDVGAGLYVDRREYAVSLARNGLNVTG